MGGILGTLLVSYLGVEGTFGGLGINKETAAEQLNALQAQGCIAAIALSVVATFLIVKFVGDQSPAESEFQKMMRQRGLTNPLMERMVIPLTNIYL